MRLQDEVNSTFLWACMKAMKMGLEGLLIQNSALTIPSVTRTFTGKNMLWPITYIFCLVKDWEFCKLFSVQWSLKTNFSWPFLGLIFSSPGFRKIHNTLNIHQNRENHDQI